MKNLLKQRQITTSCEETHLLGKTLAKELCSGAVVALCGDLGAGKTTFIRGMVEEIGGIDTRAVCSPTFTFLNIYSGALPIYHFDLYRLPSATAFFQAGFDEYFHAGGICCIEWAEKNSSPSASIHSVCPFFLYGRYAKRDLLDMKKIPFTQAQFIASAFTIESFPKPVDRQGSPLSEVALVGRSNVGKSSLINHLLRNRTLAKTSSTPGKTQSVNFYTVNDQLALVDLPGYGYAKAGKTIKKQWAPLIDAYLEESLNLKLVLLLIDSRREFNEEDQAMIDWTLSRQIPLLLIFTKSDKLNVAETIRHKREFSMFSSLYYSVKDPLARIALTETLNLQLHTHGTYQ